jgi:hypothetical protein
MDVVHEADKRLAKPGWMLWQWFDFEDLEADGVISRLKAKLEKVKEVSTSMEKLAEFMRWEIQQYEEEIKGRDEIQSEAEYENSFLNLVKADQRGILLLHPYFVSKTIDQLQNMWKNFCTAAGVRFHSIMTKPDESLAHYHVVHEDGRITGRKVFCAKDFKEGEYIVFCNHIRHWGDVQVWENVHEGRYVNDVGVMGVPTKLALTLCRDFDGNFIQLISTKNYPNIANRIKNFPLPSNTVNFPKVALPGNVPQVASGSRTDMTGLVCSLLAQCRALRSENQVLLIPKGAGQVNDQEMRLIDFLSQQLQIAIDSVKSAYPNNTVGLYFVRDFLFTAYRDAYSKEEAHFDNISPWLKSLQQKDTFVSKPCDVIEEVPDTISRLVRLVNSYWEEFAIKYEDHIPKDYQHALFFDVKSDPVQDQLAKRHTDWYQVHMGNAINECNELAAKGIYANEAIRVINTRVRNYRKKLETDPDKSQFTMESWAAAYWRAANRRISGKATIVFTMFHQEIIEELKNYGDNLPDHLIVYGVNKNEFAHPTYQWTGEKVTVQIREMEAWIQWDKAQKLIGFHCLGRVGTKYIAFLRKMRCNNSSE